MSQPQVAAKQTPYTVYPATAAADIEEDSQVLMVICPDLLPHSTAGDVVGGSVTSSINIATPSGTKSQADATFVNYLTATWEGISGHRYPPMVRRGEPIEVYKLANQDKLYWRASGRGRNYRTTDRMYVEISATATNSPNPNTNTSSTPDGEKNDDTTYSFYMDSIAKKIGFKTSMVNGETNQFSGEFDLAAGTWSITDNSSVTKADDGSSVGNRIYMDTGSVSGIPVFQVNIASGATLKFQKDDCYIKIPKKCFVDIGERLVYNSPLTYINNTAAGYIFVNAKNVVVSVAKDITATIGGVLGISAPNTKLSGNFIAANIRAVSFITGVVGAIYKSSICSNPSFDNVTEASNVADTNFTGSGNRHAAASEQLVSFSNLVTSLFNEVKSKVGAPADTSGLNPIATASKIDNVQGDT